MRSEWSVPLVPAGATQQLWEHLHKHGAYGPEAAVSVATLIRTFRPDPAWKVTSVSLRKLVSAAPAARWPICSGHLGFYLPVTREDIDACVAHLTARSAAMTDRCQHLRALAQEYPTRAQASLMGLVSA